MMFTSRNKRLLAYIFGAALLIGVGFFIFYPRTPVAPIQDGLDPQFQPDLVAEPAIRNFMGEPNIQLSNQGLRNPSNFTVAKREIIDSNGSDRMVTPSEWERKVYIYDQTNIASNCQFYSYEVDARSGKVVQVQLIGSLAVGSEGDLAKAECEKTNSLPEITSATAEDLAWAIARKNVPNLSDSKGEVSFDQGDRYIWMWQDKTYKLPEGLTSEPWQYPTIRVILDKQGRLMTYLNTTFLYAPNQ